MLRLCRPSGILAIPHAALLLTVLLTFDSQAQTIITEDFEGAWPTGAWYTLPGSGCRWGITNVDADTGSGSASPIADESCEGDPAGPYPEDVNNWMIYGPFDLSDAVTAEVLFRYKAELESNADYLHVGYSNVPPGQVTLAFSVSGGDYTWTDGVADISAMAGESQVWVSFLMVSDASATDDSGVLVDNISIEKSTTLPTYDLALQSIDAVDGTHLPGEQIGAPTVIENVSAEDAPTYTVEFYVSSDSTITEDDTSLGFFARPALPAGMTDNLNAGLNLPNDLPNGDYYITWPAPGPC